MQSPFAYNAIICMPTTMQPELFTMRCIPIENKVISLLLDFSAK